MGSNITEYAASISPTHRVTKLFILDRAYCTPELLYRIGRRENSEGARCSQSPGSFIYKFWKRPMIFGYWQEVLDILSSVNNTRLTPNPVSCLLGYVNPNSMDNDQIVAIIRTLFYSTQVDNLLLGFIQPSYPWGLDLGN